MAASKRGVFAPAIRCGLFLAAMALTPAVAGTDKYTYRYIDDRGKTVLDDRVPPEAVARGYTVLGPDGRVVREVEPALDSEAAAARRDAREEQKRLREWDESLLRRYSSVEDIRAARERALRELKVRINILRSNLLSVKSQIEREQARAADLERRGVEVPEELTETIGVLQREVDDTEDAIALRREEMETVREEYQRDIDRFRTLQSQVELRGRAAGGDAAGGSE